MRLKRILVPVDLSRNSLAAIDYAAGLSKTTGGEVIALFVVEPIVYASMDGVYGPGAEWATMIREQEACGRAELAKLEKSAKRRMPRFRALMRSGSPALTIAAEAKKLRADLIVMSTHGRTGLSRALLGSVADKVVRNAPCPVLTIRPGAAVKRLAVRRNPRRHARAA
jgi:universal stress protein A